MDLSIIIKEKAMVLTKPVAHWSPPAEGFMEVHVDQVLSGLHITEPPELGCEDTTKRWFGLKPFGMSMHQIL